MNTARKTTQNRISQIGGASSNLVHEGGSSYPCSTSCDSSHSFGSESDAETLGGGGVGIVSFPGGQNSFSSNSHQSSHVIIIIL